MSRLSDILERRRSWALVNQALRELEPGDVRVFECPPGISIAAFRSHVLTIGNRYHKAEWRVSTRTERNLVHAFLSPRS